MATSRTLDDVVGLGLATLPDGTEYRQVLSTPSDGATHVTPDGRTWVAVREGVVNGQVVQTPLTIQWKGKVASAVADAAEILEHLMGLASRKIDVIATRVQFEPPGAEAAAVVLLHRLSAAMQKLISDFDETVQSLSEADRASMSLTLEKSGVVSTMNLLMPLLEMGEID